MFDETFERKIYCTELPAWKFLNLLFRGFLGTKGEKLFRNHKRSAAELPVVKMPVVTENPLLTLTHRLLSSKPTSRWWGKGWWIFISIWKKWNNSVEESGIRLGHVIIANFSLRKIIFPIKKESDLKIIKRSIFWVVPIHMAFEWVKNSKKN